MSKFQTDRPNPLKPSVVKECHVWWAKAYDRYGNFYTESFSTHAGAIAKAREYARMVKA